MLILNDEVKQYLEEVKKFASSIKMLDDLEKQLKYLNDYGNGGDNPEDYTKCYLHKDAAPYSFSFSISRKNKDQDYSTWFRGGLIFHGDHDGHGSGRGPTYAVTLNPASDWSIHT